MVVRKATILATALLALSTGPIHAQTPPPQLAPPAGSPLPRVEPLPTPAIQLPAPAAPAPSAKPMPAADVAVTSVAVEGVTAYDRASLLARSCSTPVPTATCSAPSRSASMPPGRCAS
jgi:hypothetical protein